MNNQKKWINFLRTLQESSALKEQAIIRENLQARKDPKTRELLWQIYLDTDRAASLQRFLESHEARAYLDIVARIARGNKNIKICEIGAGPGFLSFALQRAGYQNVSIVEPNNLKITGTGYLQSLKKMHTIKIWNNLKTWYADDDKYDLIISKACIHHFDNINKLALEIRLKMADTGSWMAFDEAFIYDTHDLLKSLTEHPHAHKYRLYEWFYEPQIYIGLIELAGFSVSGIIPNRYGNNYLIRNVTSTAKLTGLVTALTNVLLKLRLSRIVYEIEHRIFDLFHLPKRFRLFTMPQLIIFRGRKIDLPAFDRNK